MAELLPSNAEAAEHFARPLGGTDRHLVIRMMRGVAVQRAQEVQMAAGQLALLLHADPENDAEVDRWLAILDQAGTDFATSIMRERALRDIGGIA